MHDTCSGAKACQYKDKEDARVKAQACSWPIHPTLTALRLRSRQHRLYKVLATLPRRLIFR